MRDEAFFMQSKNPYRVNIGQDIVMQIEEKQSVGEVEKNEEIVQEEKREEEKDVRDEECVPKKDLLKKALDICDINEESMFEPDLPGGGGGVGSREGGSSTEDRR